MSSKGKMIAVSAPSGTGKSTICTALLEKHEELKLSISATSRMPRGQEKNGEEYIFLSEDDFLNKIKNNDFLEYEEVHGKYYGTLKDKVNKWLDEGCNVLLDIDVNGAIALKEKHPEMILIFIKPPSIEELRKRLEDRGTETKEQIDKRMLRTQYEFEQSKKFDYVIINNILGDAIQEMERIIFNKG